MNTQAYWDDKHDEYTATSWIDIPSIFAEWTLQYLPGSGTLLDLGAGQGQDSRFFSAKGYAVTSTDFSEHALELGRQKSPSGINFMQVDLSKLLPFADESYDVIYAHLSMHYFDKATTEKLFAEVLRVLKPGGILAALFNSTRDPEVAEGKQLEDNFIDLVSIQKRYFSPKDARNFAKGFEIKVADNQGTAYKDQAKGVTNLTRLIAIKQL